MISIILSCQWDFVVDNVLDILLFNFSPWNVAPYKDAVEKTALGGLSLDAFLSEVFMVFSLLKMGIPYFINLIRINSLLTKQSHGNFFYVLVYKNLDLLLFGFLQFNH